MIDSNGTIFFRENVDQLCQNESGGEGGGLINTNIAKLIQEKIRLS